MRHALLATITLLCSGLPAIALTPGDTIAEFESLCLASRDVAVARIETLGIGALPETDAKPFLEPATGKAYAIWDGTVGVSIVSLADNGTCALFEPNVSGKQTEYLFQSRFSHNLISSQHEGADGKDFFAVTYMGRHVYVMFHMPEIQSDKNGLSIAAIPERMLRCSRRDLAALDGFEKRFGN